MVFFLCLPPQTVHSITLLLNLLACLAWFTVDNSRGVDFGLSILWLILFTPCAFLCWYRPIYKAFRQVLGVSFCISWWEELWVYLFPSCIARRIFPALCIISQTQTTVSLNILDLSDRT